VPEEAVPEEAGPEEAVPEEAVPEEAGPEEAVPEEAVPEESLPPEEETVPPEETVPSAQMDAARSLTGPPSEDTGVSGQDVWPQVHGLPGSSLTRRSPAFHPLLIRTGSAT
jgi:hypothetical protein